MHCDCRPSHFCCLGLNAPIYKMCVCPKQQSSQVALVVKNPPANAGDREMSVLSQIGKIPWKRAWKPTPVFLPRESPWTEEPGGLQSAGCKELDMTE